MNYKTNKQIRKQANEENYKLRERIETIQSENVRLNEALDHSSKRIEFLDQEIIRKDHKIQMLTRDDLSDSW